MPSSIVTCPIRDCVQKERGGFYDKALLIQHLLNFHVHTIFHCVDCRLDLPGASTVVQHARQQHNEIYPHIVDVRDRVESDSDIEIVDEVLPVLPILSCQRCSFKTRNRMELYEHCSSHPELKFNCVFCDYKCSTYAEIHRHRETSHGNIRPLLKCRFDCGYRSMNAGSVRHHEQSCPKNQKRYQCLTCGFTTTSDVQYKLHSNSLAHRLRTQTLKTSKENSATDLQFETADPLNNHGSLKKLDYSKNAANISNNSSSSRDNKKLIDIMVNKWSGKVYVNGKSLTEDMRKRKPGSKRIKLTKKTGRRKNT